MKYIIKSIFVMFLLAIIFLTGCTPANLELRNLLDNQDLTTYSAFVRSYQYHGGAASSWLDYYYEVDNKDLRFLQGCEHGLMRHSGTHLYANITMENYFEIPNAPKGTSTNYSRQRVMFFADIFSQIFNTINNTKIIKGKKNGTICYNPENSFSQFCFKENELVYFEMNRKYFNYINDSEVENKDRIFWHNKAYFDFEDTNLNDSNSCYRD